MNNNQQGMVLLVVLVIVVFLTSLVVEFSFSTFVQLRLTETFRDSTKAYYLAKGGVQAARMLLLNDTNDYDAHSETWGQPWENIAAADGTVSLKIEDLDGKLDVNRLVTDQGNIDVNFKNRFLLFFENLEIPEREELTDALIDWLDPDNDPQPAGAENNYYEREKNYTCPNGKLGSLDELLKIKGFSEEIVRKIRPHLTVAGSKEINANTAGVEVLMALNSAMTSEVATYMVEHRKESPFEKLSDVKEMSGMSDDTYFAVKSSLKVKSNHFFVRSLARINDTSKRVEAIIQKDNNLMLSFKVE
ncbi:MAG: type II secretion system minor pseudopilin GspK [Deltaproteobacteria bacterium]|nr:type II secretion system minor pseudopilin GspK [Deltaproteobacteria bacterium]